MPAPRRAHLPLGSDATSSYQTGQVGVVGGMTFVPVTANRGKSYLVTVVSGEAVGISSIIRTRNSIGHTTYSRKLWAKGDERISLTAHCALNAWRRLTRENINARFEASR